MLNGDLRFVQIWLNYLELLEGEGTVQPKPDFMGLVDRIMLMEREAVLCQSLSQAAHRGASFLWDSLALGKTNSIQPLCLDQTPRCCNWLAAGFSVLALT